MTRLCLFGAAPDTGNLGVSALCFGTLGAILRREPKARVTVFDYGRGLRTARFPTSAGTLAYDSCGASDTRRLYRRESLWNIRASARFGGLGSPAAGRILEADAILDISGGDSFTDLYGTRRWNAVATPKRLALELRKPLILLPQTYGPFNDPNVRREAARLVRGAAMAWARDERSFDVMRELLAERFDPARHRSGVDVAFLLEPREPADVSAALRQLIAAHTRPLAGINISGLLYHDPEAARSQYKLKADYRAAVHALVSRLAKSGADIILTPHVVTPPGHYESDTEACLQTAEACGLAANVYVAPAMEAPGEVKWLISKMDWFCGTRMHSTIASLSSGVPTSAIAYSGKTLGVFESCGQGGYVSDPRSLDTEELVQSVWNSWLSRGEARRTLAERLPETIRRAGAQMDEVLTACRKSAPMESPA